MQPRSIWDRTARPGMVNGGLPTIGCASHLGPNVDGLVVLLIPLAGHRCLAIVVPRVAAPVARGVHKGGILLLQAGSCSRNVQAQHTFKECANSPATTC